MADTDSFDICTMGDSSSVGDFSLLLNRQVHGRSIRILHLGGPNQAIDHCETLYLSGVDKAEMDNILEVLRHHGSPILTISDADQFIDLGGIGGLRQVDQRIKFEFNRSASRDADLIISSRLLDLAVRVVD